MTVGWPGLAYEKRSHYNWHWFWDTGNGDTGNQDLSLCAVGD